MIGKKKDEQGILFKKYGLESHNNDDACNTSFDSEEEVGDDRMREDDEGFEVNSAISDEQERDQAVQRDHG